MNGRRADDAPLGPGEPDVVDLLGKLTVEVLVDLGALRLVGGDPALLEQPVDLGVVEATEVDRRAGVPPDVLQVRVAARVVAPGQGAEVAGDGTVDLGRLVGRLQLHLDAGLCQLGLPQLDGGLGVGAARIGHGEAELLARLLLVRGHVLLGGGEVEARHAGVLEIPHRAGRKGSRSHLEQSVVEDLVGRLRVECLGDRKPGVLIVERRLRLVEQEVVHLGVVRVVHQVDHPLLGQRLGLGEGLAPLDVGGVVGAGLDALDALGQLRLGPELDRVQVGQRLAVLALLPVVGVLLGGEVVVDLPLLLHERTGADQVLVAAFGVVQLGLPDDAQAAVVPQEAGKGRPRGLGRHLDRQVVGGLDRVDVVEHEHEQQRLAGRVLTPVSVEVVLHHLGGQVGAVVKLHALAQVDRPLVEGGVRLDRLGQHRLHVAGRIGLQQRVVDRPGHLDARDGQLGLLKAPARVGLALQGIDHLAAPLGCALVPVALGAAGGVPSPTTAGGGAQGQCQNCCDTARSSSCSHRVPLR